MHGRRAAGAWLLWGAVAALESRGQAPANPPAPSTSAPAPSSLGSTSPAPAQNAPELTSHDAPATFSAKVNLVMVPVVVRDGNGKAIGTLQKEDFQLFDKGKPQVISRFSIEKAGELVIPAEVATDEAATDKGEKS